MRRLTLALSFTLVLSPVLLAQQAPQTARPVTPPPSVSTSATQTAPPTVVSGQQGRQSPRPVFPVLPRQFSSVTQAGATQNILLTIRISDSFTSDVQTTKTVTMLVADGQSGQIRSSGGGAEGVINVDAQPQVQRDGRIRLQLTVEYRPDLAPDQYEQLVKSAKGASIRIQTLAESLTVILGDGRATLVSQSSDPRSDRKVSVEATAAIVK